MRVIRAAFVVALLAMSVAWLLLFRPTFLGGPATYVQVYGTSMEPTLDSGDLVLVRQQGNYGNGDIVAFRVPEGEPGEGAIVIHRIVDGTAKEGFVMQGDNKEVFDPWRPTGDDVVGRLWFSIPVGGRLLAILQSPLLLAALASGAAVFLVMIGGEEKKRTPQPCPARPSHAIRRRRSLGFGPRLLLILLSGIGTALLFARLHQGGGRHP